MKKIYFVVSVCAWLCAITVLLVQNGCTDSDTPPTSPTIDMTKIPYLRLSDYHFFSGDMAEMTPNDGVLPYDLNTPLFSNYAQKARFVYVPPGQTAAYNDSSYLDLPVGSVLIKTFYYAEDIRNAASPKNLIETRLLIHTDTAWIPASYIWNAQQTEADFDVAGRIISVDWTHYDGQTKNIWYQIPNKNDCRGCHNLNKKTVPIGPKAFHLNKDFVYPDGTTANQLEKWASAGILTGTPPTPDTAPKVAVWDDPDSGTLEQRARAYMDINCAHCHNPQGPANNAGLDLRYHITNPTLLGVCKVPVAAGGGSGGLKVDIFPGKPDSSILIYRLNSIEPAVAMPELARSTVHEEGLQLLRDWISSLDGDCD